MSWPTPFSLDEPCITCGAGLSYSPDAHQEWCADIAAINATIKGSLSSYQLPSCAAEHLRLCDARLPGRRTEPGNPHGHHGRAAS